MDVEAISSYLNESPYEKVGKYDLIPKTAGLLLDLNESPYEKVGKSHAEHHPRQHPPAPQ